MSDISQEYSDDEDMAPYDDNMPVHNSDSFATVTTSDSQEEYDDRAVGKGPLIQMGTMVMDNLEKITRCSVSLDAHCKSEAFPLYV
jgi:hypothetical protein